MTSVDELFKKSGLPSKRKLEPLRNPDEVYKSAKLSSDSSRHTAQADDAPEDEDLEAGPAPPPDGEDDDGDYGPSMPPEDDAEDEEGRFFGGGVTAQESRALDYINETDGNDESLLTEEKIDFPWLKKTALKFEQRINKNATQRAKYESDPSKFIQSEADLDADIKALSILGEHPELYPQLVELGTVGSLVGLLAHENTDIAIGAIEIIGELTDEDVAAEDEQWDALVNALLEADVIGLLVSNLQRLNEDGDDEADREGVYKALAVVENLCSNALTAEKIGAEDGLLKWLLQRIQRKERPITQNKQYAAEILAILVQTSAANRRKLASLDAVDSMLQLVASYRKLDPEKGQEEEYMENLFEALTSIVDEPEGKKKFIDAEGMELCLIMLKEGKRSKSAALRLVDHAVGGSLGTEACQKVVEAGGLKTFFTMFMKKHPDNQTTEHLVSIFSWMLRLLPGDSPERIRLLAKFVEKDYEKADKLVKLRRDFAARLRLIDEQLDKDKAQYTEAADFEDERFLRRLDAGLFTLQTVDVVLAWLVAEDGGAQKKIQALLADRDETFQVLKTSLQERLDAIDDKESQDGKDSADMLIALMEFL
ncbi:Catenin-beta-like protein [Coniella lustricola]|uniref:Catenin-beta-like protein n=1 Tax=Coniella lustricola TaxID=2025994 RepID=A0A2T3A405_9PEZI|nr:Catenin-beta-like protein [Coniella lustricola]